MLGSIPHQKFCFYHLPTRGRAGIKLGDAWYVSNVSIIFDCSMLLYYLFWMLMGLFLHFYIIFGTNLLTGGPAQIVVFAYFRVSPKRNIKRSPIRMKPWGALFLEQTWSRRLGVDVKQSTRRPQGRGARPPPWACPPPSWAPRGPMMYFFLLYIPIYPKTIGEHNRSGVPLPEASVATENQSRPVPAPCRRGNPSPVAIFIIPALSITRRE